jgi:hypothetical protein
MKSSLVALPRSSPKRASVLAEVELKKLFDAKEMKLGKLAGVQADIWYQPLVQGEGYVGL